MLRILPAFLAACHLLLAHVAITPAPNGPYTIRGNRILDRNGVPWLVRGTRLTPLTADPADLDGDSEHFGPLSATALIGIRQRLNMNAVRLPLDPDQYLASADYRNRSQRVIRNAREFELLVIVEANAPASAVFWRRVAAENKTDPDLFYAPESTPFVSAIRASGATQPVILTSENDDHSVILQITPRYATMRTPGDREALLGPPAARFPVLVNDLDPRLNEDSPECQSFPPDPADATDLVEGHLEYFDSHNISWTLSSFTPHRLISDYRYFVGTKLDNGWTCGKPGPEAEGLGMVILSHLWHAKPHGLFTVSSTRGGFVVSRGGVAIGYGPILTDKERHGVEPLPHKLGNVRVRITDSRGVERLAPLLYAGAGWSQINFVIPPESARGPAEAAVVRDDGSVSRSEILIEDLAPGLLTAPADGRGPALATVVQHLLTGAVRTLNAAQCDAGVCKCIDISLAAGIDTTVELHATGVRYARPKANITVTIAGRRLVPVSIARGGENGIDSVVFRIPPDFHPQGETDVWLAVDGVMSNVARLRFVASSPSRKVALGRYLFYDKRLSVNGTTACSTCHRQELAFTDGLPRARGATGDLHPRSAMSLVNLARSANYNWSDPNTHSLEQQALKPMMSTEPVELGFGSIQEAFLHMARRDQIYRPLFLEAFPGERDPWTVANMARALAAFERTIVSNDSPYDRYHLHGDENAISEAAKRGEILFYSDGPACFRCHSGADFTDTTTFHNTGLYKSYPPPNFGLYQFTRRLADAGKFKAPTLRNIALTAPYMHDGSVLTLEEVIDHYAAGGRGHDNPYKDRLVHGFPATPQNRADLVAFLQSLTDETLLRNPAFSDPWK